MKLFSSCGARRREKIDAGRDHDAEREPEQCAVVEGPREVAAEQVHGARAVDDDVVVTEDGEKEVEHFFVFRMKTLRADVEEEIAVSIGAREPAHVVVSLHDDGTPALTQDLVGEAEPGHSRSDDEEIRTFVGHWCHKSIWQYTFKGRSLPKR